jgi:RNA polymerase sigma-70 factor (ECF subfamily)
VPARHRDPRLHRARPSHRSATSLALQPFELVVDRPLRGDPGAGGVGEGTLLALLLLQGGGRSIRGGAPLGEPAAQRIKAWLHHEGEHPDDTGHDDRADGPQPQRREELQQRDDADADDGGDDDGDEDLLADGAGAGGGAGSFLGVAQQEVVEGGARGVAARRQRDAGGELPSWLWTVIIDHGGVVARRRRRRRRRSGRAQAPRRAPGRCSTREPVAVDARTDEELMLAYKGGQPRAYRVLVERHHAPVYRFCLRALRNPEAAADATQEIFLRVVKNAPSWEQKAKFTTWLYTMARNFCIDEVRKAKFRRTDSLNEPVARDGDSGEERLDRVASDVPAADRLADNVRLRRALDEAIAALPDEQRAVFLLREQGGLQFKDIADVTGVGENTVKSRMRYALGALQKRLAGAGFGRDEPGDSAAQPGKDPADRPAGAPARAPDRAPEDRAERHPERPPDAPAVPRTSTT